MIAIGVWNYAFYSAHFNYTLLILEHMWSCFCSHGLDVEGRGRNYVPSNPKILSSRKVGIGFIVFKSKLRCCIFFKIITFFKRE